jgi:hypothetical protein
MTRLTAKQLAKRRYNATQNTKLKNCAVYLDRKTDRALLEYLSKAESIGRELKRLALVGFHLEQTKSTEDELRLK